MKRFFRRIFYGLIVILIFLLVIWIWFELFVNCPAVPIGGMFLILAYCIGILVDGISEE